MPTVLVAEDEPPMQRILKRLLEDHGCSTTIVECGEDALKAVRAQRPDLVLLDLQMPGIGGMATLERLGVDAPGLPVVIMTATGSIEIAVDAFKRGAVDFVTKPFDQSKLFAAVDAAVSGRPSAASAELDVVGESPRFREAMSLALRFAPPEINVLLHGETGTGKELFARAIHAASKRKNAPFVPVDCTHFTETLLESELFGHEKAAFTGADKTHIGHFERADGGTIFLDEIGNLSLLTQAKLLRVLQERTIVRAGGSKTIRLDIRVISATNLDLNAAIRDGRFRSDLYFRLAETMISTPPLRDRAGDVVRLAQHFIEHYAARWDRKARKLAPEAVALLEEYSWPGNVRELENVIKSAVVLADELVLPEHLRLMDLPDVSMRPHAAPSAPPSEDRPRDSGNGTAVEDGDRFHIALDIGSGNLDLKVLAGIAAEKAERAVLESLIRSGNYNQTQLAKRVNLDPKTLRDKLKKYRLKA